MFTVEVARAEAARVGPFDCLRELPTAKSLENDARDSAAIATRDAPFRASEGCRWANCAAHAVQWLRRGKQTSLIAASRRYERFVFLDADTLLCARSSLAPLLERALDDADVALVPAPRTHNERMLARAFPELPPERLPRELNTGLIASRGRRTAPPRPST